MGELDSKGRATQTLSQQIKRDIPYWSGGIVTI